MHSLALCRNYLMVRPFHIWIGQETSLVRVSLLYQPCARWSGPGTDNPLRKAAPVDFCAIIQDRRGIIEVKVYHLRYVLLAHLRWRAGRHEADMRRVLSIGRRLLSLFVHATTKSLPRRTAKLQPG